MVKTVKVWMSDTCSLNCTAGDVYLDTWCGEDFIWCDEKIVHELALGGAWRGVFEALGVPRCPYYLEVEVSAATFWLV